VLVLAHLLAPLLDYRTQTSSQLLLRKGNDGQTATTEGTNGPGPGRILTGPPNWSARLLPTRIPSALVRVDLHVHTSASFDCEVEPLQVARRCHSLGLGPVFITDHDTIDGGLRIRSEAPAIEVVIGQEITTTRGELIGLFLERPIPAGMEPAEAVSEIKAQGGLVYLQHPYDAFRRRLEADAITEIADQIDIVETWNGRSSKEQNLLAEDLALTLAVPFGAGSDAHTLDEMGSVYVELGAFEGPAEFLGSLAAGRVIIKPRRLLMRAGAAVRAARGRARL